MILILRWGGGGGGEWRARYKNLAEEKEKRFGELQRELASTDKIALQEDRKVQHKK